MKKSTILKWGFVLSLILFCSFKLITNGDDQLVYETEEVDVPAVVIDGSEPPVIEVNIIQKEEEIPPAKEPIDKTVPHFDIEVGEASYAIYSNDLTRIPENAKGEYFFYRFKNDNEITVYLQEKSDIWSLEEMEDNYDNKEFCEENNLKVFKKETADDGIMYLLSYSDSETPNVVEIWKENEKAILNVYYVSYEEIIDEVTIESIKDFMNHIEDTTAKG